MDEVGGIVGGIVRMDILTNAVGAEDFEEIFGGVDGVLGGMREAEELSGRGVNNDVDKFVAVLVGWKWSEPVRG